MLKLKPGLSLCLGPSLAVISLAQDVQHPLHLGGNVKPPILLSKGVSQLTTEIDHNDWHGETNVIAVIDQSGLVAALKIASSCGRGDLDDKALEAIHRYTFRPAMQKGKPVAVVMTFVIDFDDSHDKR